MKWLEEDFSFLLSTADEFGEYITSQVNDWNLHSSRLVLTPGRVLLALTRLSSVQLTDPRIPNLLESIKAQIDAKSFLWQKKVDQELPRRLRVWENALKEYREEGLDNSYVAQVVNRTIIGLLQKAAYSIPPGFETHLLKLDDELRTIGSPGDFIWDKQLKAAFPDTDYWFLYIGKKKG